MRLNPNSGAFGVLAVIAIAIKIGIIALIVWYIYSIISNPAIIGEFAGKIVAGFNSVK